MNNVSIEILPSGNLKISRGNKEQNEVIKKILQQFSLTDKNWEELNSFFEGSEEVILLKGDRIFCG